MNLKHAILIKARYFSETSWDHNLISEVPWFQEYQNVYMHQYKLDCG